MKTKDNTKKVVLGVGAVIVAVSLLGAISVMSFINFLFPLYIGLSLIGLTVLHKEEPLPQHAQ